MASTIIAVVGSLLGVVLGFLIQYLQANRAHKWHLEDQKRDAYAELLRSISASYAQAYSGEGASEDANILRAISVIELLSETKISRAARRLQMRVDRAHKILRAEGYEAAAEAIDKADHDRLELVKLFHDDLDIRQPRMSAS
jgi:hypothetical protein